MHKLRLKTFLIFELIGTAIWLSALMFIGFLSATGVHSAVSAFHEYTLILTAVAESFLIVKVISIWITKRIEKK